MNYRMIYSDPFAQVIVFEPEGESDGNGENQRQAVPVLHEEGNGHCESQRSGLPRPGVHVPLAAIASEVGNQT